MILRSIRWRLTAWFSVVLFCILAVFGVSFILLLQARFSAELDKQLREDFRIAQNNLAVRNENQVYWLSNETPHDETGLNEFWVHLYTLDEKILLKMPEGWDPSLNHLRYYSAPVHVGDHEYLLKVGRTENPMRNSLHHTSLMLALLIPLGVAIAGFGGSFLTSRMLFPLRELTRRAKTISPHQLSERLPVENPSDEIGQLANVFNEALGRLEDAFSQMQRFTANASHELRTPLTCLRTTGELALRNCKNVDEFREAVGSMLEEVDRLTRLINSMLILARAEAGQLKTTSESVELTSLSTKVAEQIGVLAEEKGQYIKLSSSGEVWTQGDPALIRQAITNLLDNAIKYSPANSEIRVSTFLRDQQAVLEVADSGVGIPVGQREKIFERFYRVDLSRAQTSGGVGLGLPICQWIANLHHGKIEVICPPEGGSIFRLQLAATHR